MPKSTSDCGATGCKRLWPKVRLGNVCKIAAGNSAPQDKALFQGGKYPFIRTSDVGEIHFGVIENSRNKLNDAGIKGLRLFPKGSILFPKSGASTYLNHRVLLGVDAYVVSHLAVIMPSEKVYPEFLLHALSLVDAKSLMQDNSYPSLRADEIGAAEIPLPPLAEQKKIVEKVEKALKRVDALKAQFERMEKSAADYFKATLAETFAAVKGEKVKLGDVCECKKGPFGSALVKRLFVPRGAHTIKVYEQKNAIRKNAKIGDYYITEEYFNSAMRGFEVVPGDIIVSCAGTIGETYVLPKDCERGIINQALMRIRLHDKVLTPFFLYYFDLLIGIVNGASKGTAIRNIPPFKIFKALPILIPSCKEQEQIVEKIDAAKSKSDRMVAAARRGIEICGKMRKAILAEAFQ